MYALPVEICQSGIPYKLRYEILKVFLNSAHVIANKHKSIARKNGAKQTANGNALNSSKTFLFYQYTFLHPLQCLPVNRSMSTEFIIIFIYRIASQ